MSYPTFQQYHMLKNQYVAAQGTVLYEMHKNMRLDTHKNSVRPSSHNVFVLQCRQLICECLMCWRDWTAVGKAVDGWITGKLWNLLLLASFQ